MSRFNPKFSEVRDKELYVARFADMEMASPDLVLMDEDGHEYHVTSNWVKGAISEDIKIIGVQLGMAMSGMGITNMTWSRDILAKTPIHAVPYQPSSTRSKEQVKLQWLQGVDIIVNDGWICDIQFLKNIPEDVKKVSLRLSQYGTKLSNQMLRSFRMRYFGYVNLELILDDKIEYIDSGAFAFSKNVNMSLYEGHDITINVSEMTSRSKVRKVWRSLAMSNNQLCPFSNTFSEIIPIVVDENEERRVSLAKKEQRVYVALRAFFETLAIPIAPIVSVSYFLYMMSCNFEIWCLSMIVRSYCWIRKQVTKE